MRKTFHSPSLCLSRRFLVDSFETINHFMSSLRRHSLRCCFFFIFLQDTSEDDEHVEREEMSLFKHSFNIHVFSVTCRNKTLFSYSHARSLHQQFQHIRLHFSSLHRPCSFLTCTVALHSFCSTCADDGNDESRVEISWFAKE